MQTTPPTVTPTPTPAPQRNDRSTFGIRLDAFVTWWTIAGAEFTALATNCYNNAVDCYNNAVAAAASAATVASLVNVTKWISGTTYALGDNTWSPITFYTYKRKTAGAGTTDPSADATNWQLISVLPTTGSTLTDPMSGTLTLTNSSNARQVINPNAAGLIISLPDATGMVASANRFEFENVGGYAVMVKDFVGSIVSWVFPSTLVNMSLDSIASTAGKWRAHCAGTPAESGVYLEKTESSFPTSASNVLPLAMVTVQLDSTYGIFLHGNGVGNQLRCQAYKITAQGLTYGANASGFDFLNDVGALDAVKVTATQIFVVYRNNTSNRVECATVDLNTGTLVCTINAIVTIEAAIACACLAVTALSATAMLVCWASGTAAGKAVVVSIAGTVCTVNTPMTFKASSVATAPDSLTVTALSATLAHVNYWASASAVNRLSVSGTTITAGTEAATSGSFIPIGIITGSATTSLMLFASGAGSSSTSEYTGGVVVTDTGSAISFSAETKLAYMGADANHVGRLVSIANGRGILYNVAGATSSGDTLHCSTVSVVFGLPVLTRPTAIKPWFNSEQGRLSKCKTAGAVGLLALSAWFLSTTAADRVKTSLQPFGGTEA